ncbi:MAG: SCO family protein [Alphaproteobacteria bacterium]|nr:SCO family protein [Alphaproteobacteria bacterium]
MKPSHIILSATMALAALAALWQVAGLRNEALTSGAVQSDAGTVLIGGDFLLTDSAGAERSSQEFLGKYLLVYFGYAFCPDVCPTDLTKLSKVMAALGGDAAQIVPIFITVDPARDTVEKLADYKNGFDSRLVMLTGSDTAIAEAAGQYRVYYAKVPEESGNGADSEKTGEYLVDHSAFTYLMGRDGKYVRHFGHEASAEEIVEAVRGILANETVK